MAKKSKSKLTRAQSSRINGAKSNGPTTEAGKQRSCLNHTSHGMHSSRVVLHNESMDTYQLLRTLFLNLFQPHDIFETECVMNMINARWRIRRLEAADAANLTLAIEEARPAFEKKFENLDTTHEHALAYRAIAQTVGHNDIMGRHEDRQHRIFSRSYRLLARHRGKSALLPSTETLQLSEDELPPDNLPVSKPLQTQPDAQNRVVEPKSPPRLKPEPPNDDISHFRPLLDALDNRPELKKAVLLALSEDRNGSHSPGSDKATRW